MNDPYEQTKELMDAMAHVKMTLNSHKGNIEDVSVGILFEFMYAEFNELKKASQDDDYIKILEEAADVQNYLIAIVHNQIKRYRERK